MTAPDHVLTLGSRRRCTLRFGHPEHRLYEATCDDAGVITLVPVRIVPTETTQEPA